MPSVLPNEIKYLRKYFPHARTVLDVGCGDMEFVKLLNNSGFSAKGLDVKPPADYICLFEDIPEDTRYDLICFRESIYYINPYKLHKKLDKIVDSNGGVYIKSCILTSGYYKKLPDDFSFEFRDKVKFLPTKQMLFLLFKRYTPIIKYYSGWINYKYYRRHGILLWAWTHGKA